MSIAVIDTGFYTRFIRKYGLSSQRMFKFPLLFYLLYSRDPVLQYLIVKNRDLRQDNRRIEFNPRYHFVINLLLRPRGAGDLFARPPRGAWTLFARPWGFPTLWALSQIGQIGGPGGASPWPSESRRRHPSSEARGMELAFPVTGAVDWRSAPAVGERQPIPGQSIDTTHYHTGFTFPGINNINHIFRQMIRRSEGPQAIPGQSIPPSQYSTFLKALKISNRAFHQPLLHQSTATHFYSSEFVFPVTTALYHTGFTFPGINDINHISRQMIRRSEGPQAIPGQSIPPSQYSTFSKALKISNRILHQALLHRAMTTHVYPSEFVLPATTTLYHTGFTFPGINNVNHISRETIRRSEEPQVIPGQSIPPSQYSTFLLIPQKSVQKKQAFEMMSEHGKRICRARGLGCHPISKALKISNRILHQALLHPSTAVPISITSITGKTGYPSTRTHEILFHLVTAKRLIRSSFEPEQTSSPHLFFPDKPAPDFHYFNPLKGVSGVSNQTPAREVKNLETLAGLKEKSAPGRESYTHDPTRTHQKMNVDLPQLTDQVYRMLERKIKIEKERRGF